MLLIRALPLILLLAGDSGWELKTDTDGVTVYTRVREGSSVHEVKAVGMFDAPPAAVWKAIRDYPHYPDTMPYTEAGKVLSTEQDGKLIWFYSVINAPFIDRRDYVIKLTDESDWKDGKGFMKVSWTAVDNMGPPPTDKMVRVKINDGYWLLEPREGGAKTYGTYYVYTDPGGSVPKWLVNKANTSAVPDVFRAIRKVVAKK